MNDRDDGPVPFQAKINGAGVFGTRCGIERPVCQHATGVKIITEHQSVFRFAPDVLPQTAEHRLRQTSTLRLDLRPYRSTARDMNIADAPTIRLDRVDVPPASTMRRTQPSR